MNAVAAPATWPCVTVPWDHQLEAFEHALAAGNCHMQAIPMGGGKSAVATAVADHIETRCVLILAPKSVLGVWPTQLATHSARSWTTWSGHVPNRNTGGTKKTATVAERAEAGSDAIHAARRINRPFVAILNFETTRSRDMSDLLLDVPWDLVIVDESHRIKAPGGKDSKIIGRICRRTRINGGRVDALTGTPMPHSPLDLWGQFRALNETVLGKSYVAFRSRYGQPRVKYRHPDGTPVYMTTPQGQLIYDGIRDDMLDELIARVAPYMYQVDADELDRKLKLQPPRDVHRTIELDPSTRRAYAGLERDLIARVDEGVVTAANAMVKVLRLAQATSGYAVNAETGEHMKLTAVPEKARLLADVLEDLPPHEPVVVFARFHHDLDQVRQVAEQTGRTYGELSGRRRDGLTDRSTMAGCDVLGAQLKSGGVGIDLTRARYAVYYSQDYSLADHQQSRKRLHRPGQDGLVTYVHLICPNTVDETVHAALQRREEVVNAVLARLRGAHVSA